MKIYRVYNLYIASELYFPELIETAGFADISISFGKIDEKAIAQHNSGNQFIGEIPDVGSFFIKKGSEIIIDPLPGVDEGLLRTIILGPILCVLLRQRGFLVLHASAVNIDNKAVAFMGGPGWGKSTLATAFHTQGYDVFTDDVMPIQITTDKLLVIPAYPQFKLWEKTANNFLGQNSDNLKPLFKDASKLSYRFSDGFQKHPLELDKIYVLDKGKEHKITQMKAQEGFIELVRHSRAINLITDEDFTKQHLHFCAELVNKVDFYRFTRKPSLEDLPKLIEMIENNVKSVNIS